MSATAKKESAAQGQGHGAHYADKAEGERDKKYTATDGTSTAAKPRRAKPPPRPSTGIPAGAAAAIIAVHVRQVMRAASIDHRTVSPTAFRVLAVIAELVAKAGARAGTAWPSVATLARLTGLKVRTVQYAVEQLIEGGYLWRRISRGRAAATNEYVLRMPHAAPDWRRAVKTEKAHEGSDYSTSDAVLKAHQIASRGCTVVHPIYYIETPGPEKQTQSEEREVRAATAPQAPKADPNHTDIQGDREISFDSEIDTSDATEDKPDVAHARVERAPQNERLYPRVSAKSAQTNTVVSDYEPSCTQHDTASDLNAEMEG